jgi:hypothetical protein
MKAFTARSFRLVSKLTAIPVLVLCAVLSVIAISRVAPGALASKSRAANNLMHNPTGHVRPMERVQVVSFSLYDVGIIPERAYAQAGLVTIALEDLSGGTTGLVIERNEEGQTFARAGEVRRKERNRRGQEELRLEAGRYQLYMADRPENRAELIIEP